MQGFLLSEAVEMQIAPQTAENAASKARLLLEGAVDPASDSTRAADGSLLFVGAKSRRRP